MFRHSSKYINLYSESAASASTFTGVVFVHFMKIHNILKLIQNYKTNSLRVSVHSKCTQIISEMKMNFHVLFTTCVLFYIKVVG